MENLHTEVNGVRVEGVIRHRSKFELTVEITHPFRDVRTPAPHIPYFARFKVTREGEQGDRVARELLAGLYRTLAYIRDNQPALRGRVETEVRPQLETRERALQSLAEQRRALRRKLRAGELDHRTYQTRVQELYKTRDELEYEKHETVHQFIEANFPADLDVDVDDILELIEKHV